jgi:hypothetical protein
VNGQYELGRSINFIARDFASDGQNLVEQPSLCGQLWLVITQAVLKGALYMFRDQRPPRCVSLAYCIVKMPCSD